MKTGNNSFVRSLVIAQALLLCLNNCMPGCLASSKSDLDYTDLNKLGGLETVIYGSAHKNLPNEKRVDSLEKILFGKTHSGSLHARIFAIATALNGTANTLSPPIAPALDREDTLKGPAPRVTSEGDWEADEPNAPASDAKQARINNSLQQAMQLYNDGQISQAEVMFKKVLSLDSRNADANYNLGAIAESRSDWEEALHYYQTALRSNPGDEDIKNAIASMQSKLASNKNNQIQPANKNTKLSSKQVELLKAKVDQAANDYAKGNYDAAIVNLKTVIAQAPDQADVYYALGQAYKAKNQNQLAADAFNHAANLAPDNKQYSDALAQINTDAGQSQNSTANHNDTFSSNNPDLNKKHGKNKSAQNNLASQNNNNNSPDAAAGEITPFSDQGNNELGWQPAGAANGSSYGGSYYTPGMSTGYMPGYTYSNSIPYSMTSVMERAAIGSLAGAAIGSMFAGRGYRMNGAFTGSMMGGMIGAMSARGRRW